MRTLKFGDRDRHHNSLLTYYCQRKAIDCSIILCQKNITAISAVVQWLMSPLMSERFGFRFPGTVITFLKLLLPVCSFVLYMFTLCSLLLECRCWKKCRPFNILVRQTTVGLVGVRAFERCRFVVPVSIPIRLLFLI